MDNKNLNVKQETFKDSGDDTLTLAMRSLFFLSASQISFSC